MLMDASRSVPLSDYRFAEKIRSDLASLRLCPVMIQYRVEHSRHDAK